MGPLEPVALAGSQSKYESNIENAIEALKELVSNDLVLQQEHVCPLLDTCPRCLVAWKVLGECLEVADADSRLRTLGQKMLEDEIEKYENAERIARSPKGRAAVHAFEQDQDHVVESLARKVGSLHGIRDGIP